MTPPPDYVISLAHPGEPLLDSGEYTSRTIEDIPHGSDGGTIVVRFDHIADNDGCRDFTDGWANTNQDGRKKKGQKEWNQMQKESKKNKLKKMFDKDRDLFARLVAEAIANGDAVPSAGAADGARSHFRTSARARIRAESDAGERLSHENGEQTRAGEEKTEDDGDDDSSARNHEDSTTTTDPRMNFKSIGEIGRTTIVKTRKTLTLGMIDEALSGTNVIKAEGSDPKYYAPVMQRLRSELVVAKAGGGKSVNMDAPALDAAWLHDGIKKMNRYYKDEKNQLQDYGGYLYDKFSAAVQAKDLVTMALCLRQVEVAEGKSGNNPFVCSPWYRQYEVDLSQDPSYTPVIRDTSPIEIDEGPRVYELQSDDDEDDDGGDDGTGTGGAGRATANVKAESDMEIEECGEVGEERAVGGKSKAPEMEMDKDGHGEKNMSKRQKKTNGSASDCNDGLRAVAGNSFAGASTTMVLGSDASNGEAAAAAAGEVAGGSGGRKTTGEGGYDDMEEEKEEGAEDAPLAIGIKIRKFFPECNSWHNGTIEAVPAPGDKSDYFRVCYDDGDDEDLDESEAQEHAQCWKDWNATQSNGDHDTAAHPQTLLFDECSERLYTDTVKLLFCYGMTSDQVRAKATPHEVSKVASFDGIVPPGATRNDKEALKRYWQRNKQRITDALEFIRGAHAAAALPGGNPLPQVAVGKALVEIANGDDHDGDENITASPFLGSNELSKYSFFKTNSGEPVEKTPELLDRLRATLAARAPDPRISIMGANGSSKMLRGPLWSRCGPHYTPDMKTLLCYMWLNDRTRGETYATAARLPGYGGAWRADKQNTIHHYYCDRGRHGDNAHRVEIIAYLRGVHAAAAVPGGPPLPPAAVSKIPADLVHNGVNIIAVPDLGSARAEDYSFFETNTGEPVEQTHSLLDLLRAALAARAAAVAARAAADGDGDDEMPPADNDNDGDAAEAAGAHGYYDGTRLRNVLTAFARIDPRTRDKSFEAASKQLNYTGMYVAGSKYNKQWRKSTKDTNSEAGRRSSLQCIREAEANVDAANGQVLDAVLEGKRLVDLADDITAVPSLSSDDIAAYAFVNRTTGELVESTADRRRQVEGALASHAPFAENGGSANGANSGVTAPAAIPAPSAVPIQDVLGVLAISVLPPSSQLGTVRDALRKNPSAVVFAAASEEMAQQQAAAAAATLPSGEAGGSGSGAWSGMGSGGLIGRSEDDLLEMLANLPASVLDGSVRDALRIDPSGLRLAAMAMWMLKERNQEQMQDKGAARASAAGLRGDANGGATSLAAIPAPSAVPIQDVLGVLAISVLPPSSQLGTVRDALQNNPSAIVFAAASEEMAQQQAAAAAATLPSGEAGGSGSGAWSGMGSGGLIGRSEDDLLEMLANLPASVLDRPVRDALRIDPSNLKLAAMAMWMLKERRQEQMQHHAARASG